jgi:hypothetical protein
VLPEDADATVRDQQYAALVPAADRRFEARRRRAGTMSLIDGSEITVIDDNAPIFVVFEEFFTSPHGAAPDYFRWRYTDGGPGGASRLENEGVTWIRGWPAPDSEELSALLAAHRLNPSLVGAKGVQGPVGCVGVTGPVGIAAP